MNAHSLRLTLGYVALSAFTLVAVSCGGSSNPAAPSPTPGGGGGGADVTITISGMNGSQSFTPNPASVTVGQTVAWRNADSITHTATANDGSFDTGDIGPGATSKAIMMTAGGSFDYHCQVHPEMVGTLTVTQ